MSIKDSEVFQKADDGGVFHWRPAAWLRVTGEDAATFLQGQFTNDLREIGPDGAVYGLWLNHKGKVLADSFVMRATDGGFWVGSYFSEAAIIRERLESFVVADDVVVEDATGEWHGVAIFGEAPVAPAGVVCFRGRREAGTTGEWVFRAGQEAAVCAQLAGRRECDVAETERRRIAAGIPAVPMDIGPGELPNEGGLETAAISYTKGCYLGQEVMARLKTMGRVRRKLLRVRGDGDVPAMPAELAQGGRKIGEMRSVTKENGGFIGLALVSLTNLRAEAPLELITGGAVYLVEKP
ncbi:MAG TPA: folate-binding protein [Opitutus sp.]|nr:folate-binding protein [Opitutus sp.]